MKKVKLLLDAIEQSIKAVETPEKKMEQLEAGRALAYSYLNGVWLALAVGLISVLEATIHMPATTTSTAS